ncbi:hypothetical protein B0A49_02884 [Cryomyces minteri]|uniref:DNA repair protein rad9 n=1 Tax=Cryomyces minteri TaxID=331657 RepID=A0A4U0X5G9_9PEZI|nr:hypothetical protein B0A49_02884 [Cryomyces minteri]
MVCRHGVTKTYKLTYESVEVMHALFDKASARNRWKISSRLLKEFIEYFGQRTEQLDFYYDNGRAILTSYTEQIKDGKEILKQPLHTQVSVDVQDFEEFDAEEKTHIIISVKDFKAIVTHADTLKTGLSACYSNPNRPLQFSYQADGMHCELTLATSGDYRATPAPTTARALPSRAASRQQSTASAPPERRIAASEMAPPPQPSSRSSAHQFRQQSKAPRPPSAQHSDPDPESLFVPPGEEDRRWDPTEYRSEEDDMLGWDASADNDIGLHPTFRDGGTLARVETHDSFPEACEEGLAPTQRLSQMHGLFS